MNDNHNACHQLDDSQPAAEGKNQNDMPTCPNGMMCDVIWERKRGWLCLIVPFWGVAQHLVSQYSAGWSRNEEVGEAFKAHKRWARSR